MSEQLKLLTGRRQKTFLAFASRILPADESGPGGGTKETVRMADYGISHMNPKVSKLLKLFLLVFELFGIFFGGKGFSKLSPEKQERQMRWFENARLTNFRLGFFGLKTFVWYGYYTRSSTWKAIGYDGPQVDRPFPDERLRDLQEDRP